VDVSPLSDDALLTQVLGSTLGLPEDAGRDRLDTVLSRLEREQLLILFDNCEHLRRPCALLAHALLSRCPGLKVLATSREPLNLPGESIFRVPPLTMRAAVELFAERAREAGALDGGPPEVVEAVCQRLDRMPLAIELAAAHARAMTSQEILRRLDDRFKLLRGGSQVAPARQQTLRATIAWSYGLLSSPERTLSDRLAIFAGGSTADAAEEICADNELPSAEVAELMEQLVDKSLLVPEVGAERSDPLLAVGDRAGARAGKPVLPARDCGVGASPCLALRRDGRAGRPGTDAERGTFVAEKPGRGKRQPESCAGLVPRPRAWT
jgi:predicted ATPase